MVGDKCASSTVDRKSTRRCGGTSESELVYIVSGGTDERDGESLSVRRVRGATIRRRGGSAGSGEAGADEEGVFGSSAAGTKGGEGQRLSPGTKETMTWTSVGGNTMGDSDAETKELVVGLLV